MSLCKLQLSKLLFPFKIRLMAAEYFSFMPAFILSLTKVAELTYQSNSISTERATSCFTSFGHFHQRTNYVSSFLPYIPSFLFLQIFTFFTSNILIYKLRNAYFSITWHFFLLSIGQSQDWCSSLIIQSVTSSEYPRRNFSCFRQSSIAAILLRLSIGILQSFPILSRFMKLSIQLIHSEKISASINFHPELKPWNPQNIFQWPVWEGDMTILL